MVSAGELCNEPYGPYLDKEVLNTAFREPKRGTLPRLRSLHILKDKNYTG